MSNEPEIRVLPNVTMTEELAKAVHDATTTDQIKNLILAAAEQQEAATTQAAADAAAAQAAADKVLADKAAADAAAQAAAAANQTYARHVVIGDQAFDFEAATEVELDRLELNALKVAYAVRRDVPEPVVAVPDAAAIAAAAEADVAAKAELERRFRLGEVTAAEYIQQSGAVKSYLEANGVSLESLQETVNANKGAKFAQSWTEAGIAFRNSPAGQDWPGGEKNQEIIALKVAAMGLTEAEDKVGALAQAYAELKRTGLYFPNGDAAPATAAAVVPAATVPAAAGTIPAVAAVVPSTDAEVLAARAALDAALARAAAKNKSASSTIFGASSGSTSAPVVSPTVVAAKQVIPDNASPQEIMAAYKEGLTAEGKDVNAAFLESLRANAVR